MRYFAISLFLILIGSSQYDSYSQLSEGGTPYSIQSKNAATKHDVLFKNMPAVNVSALLAEDFYNDEIKDQPWRFGKNIYVDFNTSNSGHWTSLSNGNRIWQLGIASKGAVSINLTFNKYKLPQGAKLFIYSADEKEILGAFTDQNNQDDGFFATSLIRGDSIIIEYFEPDKVEFPGELNLWRVTHAYRGVNDFSKSFGSSGPCHVNVRCPMGEPVRDQIRSVVLMVSGGNSLCTGALINNVNGDGIPYFLSANHCYEQPGTLVFWFNWESKTCDNPSESPEYNTLSGAVDKARWQDSDFWLMELNQTPPKEFGAYYSGWNRTTAYSYEGNVYGVHHPKGDIKKISWSDQGVDASELGQTPESGGKFWRIESWSDGTATEKGSSGSPLFDSTGKIMGQLFGGDAACGNTESDWFGIFGISWTGGGTDATRLSNWLDPDNSGLISIEGFDPEVGQYTIDGQMASIIEPFENYTDTGVIVPKVLIRNAGTQALTEAKINFRLDTLYNQTLNWSGNLEMGEKEIVELSEINPGYGVYNIISKIEVSDDENPLNDSLIRTLTILDCGEDTLPYSEGFDRNKALLCWDIVTVVPENGKIQRVSTGEKPYCAPSNGTHLIEFNSYDCISGSEVRLQSKAFSTLVMDSVVVAFDWHHDQGYTIREDKLIVQYSFDSENWNDVQEIIRYNDSLSGWHRKNIALPDTVADKSEVYFGFLFHSEYGNNCHLDNVVISAVRMKDPYPMFSAQPRVGVVDSIIVFTDESLNNPVSWEWYFGEDALPASDTGRGPHEVVYSSTGLKTISLFVDGIYVHVKYDYILIESSPFLDPFNMTARVEENDVYLEWEMTQSQFLPNDQKPTNQLSSMAKATLVDFTVYRDGAVIDTISEHAYTDTSLYPGTYEYYVVANYKAPEGISNPSDTAYAEVPVGIFPIPGNTDIKVFPNPSNGQLFIETDRTYHLVIYNNYGAAVEEMILNESTNVIDLSSYPPGMYVLQFRDHKNIFVSKVFRK